MSVSILIITQYSHRHFLDNLIKQINKQFDYDKNKLMDDEVFTYEIIVINGTRNINELSKKEHDEYTKILNDVFKKSHYMFKVFDTYDLEHNTLGAFRNYGNEQCTGDYIICMDDDDEYSDIYFEECLRALHIEKYELCGAGNQYTYDADAEIIFKIRASNKHMLINNSMAYTRDYKCKNWYNATHQYAEESTFIKETSNIKQLSRDVINVVHPYNTYAHKRYLLLNCMGRIMLNQILPKDKQDHNFNMVADYHSININTEISHMQIGHKFKKRYADIINYKPKTYDITYYCGHNSAIWDPKHTNLGGSEQAVVELCRHFSNEGKTVVVYGNFSFDEWYDDNTMVLYKNASLFNFQDKHSNLILWRMFGMVPMLELLKTRRDKLNVWVDLHDNIDEAYKIIGEYENIIKGVFFKSIYHVSCFMNVVPDFNTAKIYGLSNGVRVDTFTNKSGVQREPLRLCYTSCYTRGLIPLLAYTWPKILTYCENNRMELPELHVYYGMDYIKDYDLARTIQYYMGQVNVFNHGRCNVDKIALEKWRSNFHLYFSHSNAEIDCIAIKESLVAGCIPIISRYGVFQERDGIHVDDMPYEKDEEIKEPDGTIINVKKGDYNERRTYEELAVIVFKLLKKSTIDRFIDEIEKTRTLLGTSQTIESWEVIGDKWLKIFG